MLGRFQVERGGGLSQRSGGREEHEAGSQAPKSSSTKRGGPMERAILASFSFQFARVARHLRVRLPVTHLSCNVHVRRLSDQSWRQDRKALPWQTQLGP